jgi:hypothetical protein
MPTKRRRITRINAGELDEGQRAWLLGEEDPPKDCGVMAFNRFCWLERGDPDGMMPDFSPNARTLWEMFGQDAIEAWHARHGDQPHPLVDVLGMPEGGASFSLPSVSAKIRCQNQ